MSAFAFTTAEPVRLAAAIAPVRRTTTRPRHGTRPTTRRPVAARPRDVRFAATARPTSCRIVTQQAAWRLTDRGVAVVLSLVGAVMGSAALTIVMSFLSVSAGPLG